MTPFRSRQGYRPQPPVIGLRLMPCPPSRALESLLVALFMCLPLGVAAIYFSSKVERLYHTGHYDEAATASARARTLIVWGTLIGTVAWLVLIWLALTGTLRTPLLTLTI